MNRGREREGRRRETLGERERERKRWVETGEEGGEGAKRREKVGEGERGDLRGK